MFVSFNNTFDKKTQKQKRVPSVFIDYLNKSVPTGTKYKADNNGNCVITSESGPFQIGGFSPILTEEQKNILGKDYTLNDVLNYFYNTQKPLPIKLTKEGYIILNGDEFPIEKMAYNPLSPLKYSFDSFMMYPPEFPGPFKIMVGCDKYSRELTVKRIPNDSPYISVFESSTTESLYLRVCINEKNCEISVSLSIYSEYIKSVRDIVEAANIYNAYVDGNGFLLGHRLDYKDLSGDVKRYDDNSIAFWEKVLKVEEYLGVKFLLPADDIDADTLFVVEQLYWNLIKKVPIRDRCVVDSLYVKFDSEASIEKIKESIGRQSPFIYNEKRTIKLFGVKLELPTIVVIYNAILADVYGDADKQKLILEDESPEKRRVTALMCFKTKVDLDMYANCGWDMMIERFQNAEIPNMI